MNDLTQEVNRWGWKVGWLLLEEVLDCRRGNGRPYVDGNQQGEDVP